MFPDTARAVNPFPLCSVCRQPCWSREWFGLGEVQMAVHLDCGQRLDELLHTALAREPERYNRLAAAYAAAGDGRPA